MKSCKSAHRCEARLCHSRVISVRSTIATVANWNVDNEVDAHKHEASSMVVNSISRDRQRLYSRNGTVVVYTTSFYAVFNRSRCCRFILVIFVGFDSTEGGIPVAGNGHTCPIWCQGKGNWDMQSSAYDSIGSPVISWNNWGKAIIRENFIRVSHEFDPKLPSNRGFWGRRSFPEVGCLLPAKLWRQLLQRQAAPTNKIRETVKYRQAEGEE